MSKSNLICVAFPALLLASAVASTDPWMLLQVRNNVDKGGFEMTSTRSADIPSIDHAHIVCHHHGCAEVKAQLAAIQERMKVVKGKLEECGRHRAQLQKDLAAAAKSRGEAEKGLMECAAERKKLTDDLAQCGKDRGAAERALAQCGRDRAQLEAELKQCAEVDRPAAEKALAQCATERKALEEEFAKVIAALKGGAKPSTRRRRRAAKKTKSLVQVENHDDADNDAFNTVDEDESDEGLTDSEDASLLLEDASAGKLEARHAEIQTRLDELKQEALSWQSKLDSVQEKEILVNRLYDALMARFSKATDDEAKIDERERKVSKALAAIEAREVKSQLSQTKFDKLMQGIEAKLEEADKNVGAAQAEEASVVAEQAAAEEELIQLIQKVHHLRHEEALFAHNQSTEKLSRAETLLEDKIRAGRDEKECDALRAQVITAKAKLQETSEALATCLSTKKTIQHKIEAVERAREKAQAGLDQCLSTKARLKTALDECHKRRDSAREKLQECLNRKKELREKIDLCHTKRDDARKKLAECLSRKKELKEKIAQAKMKRSSSLAQMIREDSDIADELQASLSTMENTDKDFQQASAELAVVGNLIKRVIAEHAHISAEEESIRAEEEEASAAEAGQAQQSAELQARVKDVLHSVQQIDRDSKAASAAAKAAGKKVASVLQRLSSML